MSGKVPLSYSKFKKTANWAVPAPVRDGKVESESVRVIYGSSCLSNWVDTLALTKSHAVRQNQGLSRGMFF